jgi:hypothetical protein
MRIVLLIIWILYTFYLYYTYGSSVYTHEIYILPVQPHIPLEHNPQENVHNAVVRECLVKKYNYLREIAQKDLEKYGPNWLSILARAALLEANIQFPGCAVVLNRIRDGREKYIDSEKYIFGLVWYGFNKYKLDMAVLRQSLMDCIEDEQLVCIVGRISRYLGSFTGLLEGPLGEKEISDDLLFQEALRETYIILQNILQRDGLTEAYNSGELDVANIKSEIEADLRKKYPRIESRIPECLQAVN